MALVVSIASPADAVNAALGRIGYKWRVGDLYDGSDSASRALDIYGQTRDWLLCEQDWDFAERTANLALLKSAPPGGYVTPGSWSTAYPPPPWMFEYTYPDDCLKVRALKAVPQFIPNFAPKPIVTQVLNDASYTPARKVIVANQQFAQIVYTGRITDPATWKPQFAETLIESLGRRLAPVLADLNVEKIEAAAEQGAAIMSTMQRG